MLQKNAKMIYNLEPRDCSGLLFEMLCIFRCIAKKILQKMPKRFIIWNRVIVVDYCLLILNLWEAITISQYWWSVGLDCHQKYIVGVLASWD